MVTIRSLQDFQGLTWTGSELIQSLTEGAELFIFSYSTQLQALTSWSSNSLAILGVKDSEIISSGNLFLKHIHPADRFDIMQQFELATNEQVPYQVSYRWIKPDSNELRWLHCRATSVERNGLQLLEGAIFDISDFVNKTLAQLHGPDSLANFINTLPDLFFILDQEGKLVRLNRPDEQIKFNFGDASFKPKTLQIGKNFWSCFANTPEVNELKEQAELILADHSPYFATKHMQGTDFYQIELIPIRTDYSCAGLAIKVANVKEQLALEQKLAELKRDVSLKVMTASIAHNFNNALQSIIGHALVIQNHPENKRIIKKSSAAIINLVNSTSELSRQLYQLSAEQSENYTAFELNLAILSAINKIDALFTSGIKVAVSFATLKPVLSNQSDLKSALVDLLSILTKNLGLNESIRIRTQQLAISQSNTSNPVEKASINIFIEKDNNSSNIKLFTKQKNTPHSTASNLIITKLSKIIDDSLLNIFRNLNAEAAITRTDNDQELLTISLACAAQHISTKSDTFSELPDNLANDLDNPEILVIDDDTMVLETVRAIVNDLGYSCLTADRASVAVATYKKYKESIRLVLVDAIMPGTGGAEIIKKLLKIKRQLTIVGFSGASPDTTALLLKAGAVKILNKPVGAKELKACIADIISKKNAA